MFSLHLATAKKCSMVASLSLLLYENCLYRRIFEPVLLIDFAVGLVLTLDAEVGITSEAAVLLTRFYWIQVAFIWSHKWSFGKGLFVFVRSSTPQNSPRHIHRPRLSKSQFWQNRYFGLVTLIFNTIGALCPFSLVVMADNSSLPTSYL